MPNKIYIVFEQRDGELILPDLAHLVFWYSKYVAQHEIPPKTQANNPGKTYVVREFIVGN
jgi:hypothetical protein